MNINIDLSQKQLTTQYMIQYMNLLQMNHTELESFLEKKSLENPTIEFEKIPIGAAVNITIVPVVPLQIQIPNGHLTTGKISVNQKIG